MNSAHVLRHAFTVPGEALEQPDGVLELRPVHGFEDALLRAYLTIAAIAVVALGAVAVIERHFA